jgi:hypothetical protein
VSAGQLRNDWGIERMNLGDRQYAYSQIETRVQAGFVATGVLRDGFSILIPFGENDDIAESSDLKVSLRKTQVGWDSGPVTYLEIVCHDASLELAFAQLCSDLIEVVAGSDTAAMEARIHYDRWRALFAPQRRSGLSRNEIVGILGELITLADVVRHRKDRSIDIWTGPSKAARDFESGGHFIEVKSTTSRNGIIVGIHGLQQLDVPDGADLHLVVHRLTPSEMGISVDDQIEVLVSFGVDRIALYEKLSIAGYDWADTAGYAGLRFRRETTNWYRVDEEFPRLVSKSIVGGALPAGVINVEYAVDLTGQFPAALNEDDVLSAVRLFGRS